MVSGEVTSRRPKGTIIASLVVVLFLSTISVTNTSLWLSTFYNQPFQTVDEPVIAAAAEEVQKSSKGIINRNETARHGLHVCKCLARSDDPLAPSTPPRRLRWLHFPKTGTSFISTLWSYACSTPERYIDLSVNAQVCVTAADGKRSSFSMYDFALMRRYPWEIYGAHNFISDDNNSMPLNVKNISLGLVGGTQHFPLSPNLKDQHFVQSDRYEDLVEKKQLLRYGSELFNHNISVVAFFRQPEERIISAYKDGFHANGFTGESFANLLKKVRRAKDGLCKIGNQNYTSPIQCFANYPGIAGCMSRMLTGQKCADSLFHEAGLANVAEAVDIILNHLEFVGLTEDWNESVCQFHRLFTGKKPLQGEFANVHKSKKASISVEELDGFKDVADTVVYEAAKLKFERIVGDERCYKLMSWNEIEESHLSSEDETGSLCLPSTCSDLGKQCGEWDDGCGSTIICGLCDVGRTGLPPTWRVQCVEGKCVDYCPTWDEKGLWFLSDDSPAIMKEVANPIESSEQQYLSPVEAFEICDIACQGKQGDRDGIEAFLDTNLCQCGNAVDAFEDIEHSDFAAAHNMMTSCHESKVRKTLVSLNKTHTQPICCPPRDEETLLQGRRQWKRLFPMGGPTLEGSYFAHIFMVCGHLDECEKVAREKEADFAVFDVINSYCYLARYAFALENLYTVTKDNTRRFILDLRGTNVT